MQSMRVCRDVKAGEYRTGGRTGGWQGVSGGLWGVQAAAAGDALQTGSTIIGTYGYMAPEQFRGQATPASDLYGLGGTLLFALSGAHPPPFWEYAQHGTCRAECLAQVHTTHVPLLYRGACALRSPHCAGEQLPVMDLTALLPFCGLAQYSKWRPVALQLAWRRNKCYG